MKKLFAYLREAREEFNKVTWPTKSATLNYSLLVILISIGLAILIGAFDFGLNFGLEKIIEQTPVTTQPVDTTANPFEVAPNIQVETAPVTETN